MDKIDIALQIATKAHAGQVDRDGNPVILHPLTVGLMGHTDEERMAGFLHDVVEDTNLTFEDLHEAGIPDGIINALRLLTHQKGTPYIDYIKGIIESHNPIALQVKYNDLKHNYARGKAYPDLQKKHGPALEMVKAAIEECSKIELYKMNQWGQTPMIHPESTGSDPIDSPKIQVAVFAGGCFWGVQHQMERLDGVLRTLVGYTGGEEEFPQYAAVRDHQTHHVEAVLIEYDPERVSYTELCKLFFEIHDPSQTDGVGPDIGAQYRSCIFYANAEQKSDAEAVIQILRDKGYEVNTLVLPLGNFWIGEEYHQRYYEKTGGEPYCHVRVRKF